MSYRYRQILSNTPEFLVSYCKAEYYQIALPFLCDTVTCSSLGFFEYQVHFSTSDNWKIRESPPVAISWYHYYRGGCGCEPLPIQRQPELSTTDWKYPCVNLATMSTRMYENCIFDLGCIDYSAKLTVTLTLVTEAHKIWKRSPHRQKAVEREPHRSLRPAY